MDPHPAINSLEGDMDPTQASLVLEKAGDKHVCLLPRIPNEVLSIIFANVIFDRGTDTSNRLSMWKEVWRIYRRLYKLAAICSRWKHILMTGREFWSVIPMVIVPSTRNQEPFRLCLQRAGGHKLHLAAAVASSEKYTDLKDVLANHGPQFYAINLSAWYYDVIRDVIGSFLQHNDPVLLSQLSIQSINTFNTDEELPEDYYYIFPRNSPQNSSFARRIETLSAFHISGMHLHWDTISFSTRLVELQVGDFSLGYDKEIVLFMQALSSASELRDLKLIAVVTLLHPDKTHNENAFPVAVFPKLQTLHLQGLYLNTLAALLPMFAPGRYHSTLFLTEKSISVNVSQEDEHDNEESLESCVTRLCEILKTVPIHTLMISGRPDGVWLPEELLSKLLYALPNLKTLKMDGWRCHAKTWNNLRRAQVTQTPPQSPFPALERFRLSSSIIHDAGDFRDMVTSHPLQQIMLGARADIDSSPRGRKRVKPLEKDSDIVLWLVDNVPDVLLVDSFYIPAEFCLGLWQLW